VTTYEAGTLRAARASGIPIEELLSLSVSGLETMFHPESQMFCHRRKLTSAGLVNEGLSARYTMMSLLGLARREASGCPAPVAMRATLHGPLAGAGQLRNLGDLGLLLWLCAVAAPERVPDVCNTQVLPSFLKRSWGARERRTMELAWMLAGLAHAKLSGRADGPWLQDGASYAYGLLAKNQGSHGLFGHCATGRSLPGMLRGHIGSFADQVYPIYALAKFGQAYGVQPALEMAGRCADAICRMQGPSGQWWWHYEARTGRVFEQYPVFSVHQHGMAPMALFALMDATGIDYSGPIYSGLQWVTGTNELGRDLSDGERNMIWRGVYRRSTLGVLKSRALSLLEGKLPSIPAAGDLRVRWECRPYELGWLLYAFSGRNAEEAAKP
jgi:hypothetical protein